MAFLTSLLLVLGVLKWTIRPTQAATNYLYTSGSRILDADNHPVGLSGLNWFGFETSNYAPHGLWSRNWGDMLDQIKDLGYNVIRLPFSNAMLQPGVMPTGIDYTKNPDLKGLSALQVMDKIVAGASQRGIKIILDNHRSTPGGGPESNGLWYTSDYPESLWISDWQMLVKRYKNESSVIAVDLRNEPHGNACWGCGNPALDWRLAAEKGGNAVLAINPNLLVLVEGVSNYSGQSTWWGGNLMGAKDYPVRLNIANRLVYSPHEYPESVASQPWFTDPNYPDNLPAVWDQYWGYLVKDQTAPVLVGEFGTKYQTVKDRQWMDSFKNYISQNGLNWTFWALNPDSGDTGGLLLDDWISVDQNKQNILKQIQYGFLDSTYQPSSATPSPTNVPTATPAPIQVPPTPGPNGSNLVLDDFETGNTHLWTTFNDPNSSLTLQTVSPGRAGNYALLLRAHISNNGWGGAQMIYGAPQDWSGYRGIDFWVYGSSSGNSIRLEVLDNAATDSSGDTHERYEYSFKDNWSGWKHFTLEWSAFQRRSDWQPAGAPNDGFTRTQVGGFNFSPLSGNFSFRLDSIGLIKP